jgi:UDP-N-acetylglucosamine 2-epimerase (non-hydrolysing)
LLIFTGQQTLDSRDFGLEGFDQIHLGCPGCTNPHLHVRAVTTALLPLLRRSPALLIAQGDTSSALGASLAAFTAGVPIGHVEAGLRTHDPASPWPEEEYRTAIDGQADLLFAPTELAAENLRKEGAAGEVFITGNTGIDALLSAEQRLPPRTLNDGGMPRLLVTCHRRESWASGLDSIAAALVELGCSGIARIAMLLHPNAHVAARMRRLLGGHANIHLLEPCGHEELIRRMRDADLILSDSGGIQEEAPALGTPLLVLRGNSERPEAIASGNALLVGTDSGRIVAETRRLLEDPVALAAMARRAFPFGDGHAAPRIATIIEEWLEQRNALEPPARAAQ